MQNKCCKMSVGTRGSAVERSLHMRKIDGSTPSGSTMNKCLICKNSKNIPVCRKCAKKPFLVERARQILASINDLATLKKTYALKYAEIKNLNTSVFWNKKLSDKTSLEKQDGMTKDRIKAAFNFVPKNAGKILDIGAGHGFVEELIGKNKKIKIYGNDISNAAVKKLKGNFKGNFRKESVYRMKYPKRFFDAILMLEVLEHIPPSKVFNVLKKVREFLRKRGSFIVSVPTNEGLEKMKENLNRHTRTYTENLIRAELKIAGFKVVELKTLYAFKNFYVFKKISSKILRNRWKPNDIVILAKPE